MEMNNQGFNRANDHSKGISIHYTRPAHVSRETRLLRQVESISSPSEVISSLNHHKHQRRQKEEDKKQKYKQMEISPEILYLE